MSPTPSSTPCHHNNHKTAAGLSREGISTSLTFFHNEFRNQVLFNLLCRTHLHHPHHRLLLSLAACCTLVASFEGLQLKKSRWQEQSSSSNSRNIIYNCLSCLGVIFTLHEHLHLLNMIAYIVPNVIHCMESSR